MLIPKKTKYRKFQKGRIKGKDSNSCVHFGEYGLKSLQGGRVTEKQIESCRIAINRNIKKIGKLWVRIFSDIPVTSKPVEVRMGKGKGSVDHWMCRVKKEKVLFEISGVPYELAKKALKLGSRKLPVETKIVSK